MKWPGLAAVVVSVLHVHKGSFPAVKHLDGEAVDTITAFLFHRGGHDDPARLKANAGKSFQGSIVLGMGFTFDDTDTKGVATPIAEMHRLIAEEPRNRNAIFPYIGGEEVNTSPTHAHHRYVINFRDYPLRREDLRTLWVDADAEQRREWLRMAVVPLDYPGPAAADWPELLAIIEERVKPDRMKVNRKVRRDYWWRFGDRQPALYGAIDGLKSVLAVNCGATPHFALAFLPARMVFANSLDVFPFQSYAVFCVLQSYAHEVWARFFGSSMKDDLRYTPTDCFETFPFPEGWEDNPNLEVAGKSYYEFRANVMVHNDEGTTKTYNRFHDPDEVAPDIAKLRELHATMDRTVLDAYGWKDVPTDYEFLPEYATEERDQGSGTRAYRYRWSNHVRDAVLDRLWKLNTKRAAEEARAAVSASGATLRKSKDDSGTDKGVAIATQNSQSLLWGECDDA